MPGTWFLPPDFTFNADGPLRLGMVLPHWSKPDMVLADLKVAQKDNINLPDISIAEEPNHAHGRSRSISNGLSLRSKIGGIGSASTDVEISRGVNITFSEANHKIYTFCDPLTTETVTEIANLPKVRAQIDSGMFSKRSVYIVTGLRIATTSFTVTKELSSGLSLEVAGSGPPAAAVPVEVGANLHHNRHKGTTSCYETAPGTLFAYRLHVMRTRRRGVEEALFSHKSAFMAGADGERGERMMIVEATQAEIDLDLEEDVDYTTVELFDNECHIVPHITL